MNAFEPRRFELCRTVLSFAAAAALCLEWVGCTRTQSGAQGNQGPSAARPDSRAPSAPEGDNSPPLAPQAASQGPSAQGDNQDEELLLGQEVFNELLAKSEIVESSPLYDQLKPIADTITRAAQPQYNHPFKFYLVHEAQP